MKENTGVHPVALQAKDHFELIKSQLPDAEFTNHYAREIAFHALMLTEYGLYPVNTRERIFAQTVQLVHYSHNMGLIVSAGSKKLNIFLPA